MIGRRLVAALLVPFGVVASHTISYLLAHGEGADRARALGDFHGHLVPFALIGGLGVLAALLAACDAGYRGTRLQFTVGQLAAAQVAAFALMELGERVASGAGVDAALGEPAVWIGLILQLGIAWLARLLVQVGERAGEHFAARREPPERPSALQWRPRLLDAVPRPPLTPMSRRGPPRLFRVVI